MSAQPKRGWNLTGPDKPALRGDANPQWKGESAGVNTKRARAQRAYALGPCEKCGKPGVDRHHRDGNTGNNEPSNIGIVCRRCHMTEDGRLERFKSTSASLRGPQPAKSCSICDRVFKPLRKGRCGACAEYLRRTGQERCHNTHDAPHRAKNAAATRAAKKEEPHVGDA